MGAFRQDLLYKKWEEMLWQGHNKDSVRKAAFREGRLWKER